MKQKEIYNPLKSYGIALAKLGEKLLKANIIHNSHIEFIRYRKDEETGEYSAELKVRVILPLHLALPVCGTTSKPDVPDDSETDVKKSSSETSRKNSL